MSSGMRSGDAPAQSAANPMATLATERDSGVFFMDGSLWGLVSWRNAKVNVLEQGMQSPVHGYPSMETGRSVCSFAIKKCAELL